jgi:hypothetical protein
MVWLLPPPPQSVSSTGKMALALVDVSNPFQDFQAGFSENSSTEKKVVLLVVGKLIESNAKLSLSKIIDL